jgi:glycosyltransferase involved in cell wall biosynthesis
MKVAWLGHHRTRGGDGLITYSREMVRGLRARGVDVLFVHHGDPAGPPAVRLKSLPFIRRLVIPLPHTKQRLAALLRQQRVDLVHVSLSFSALEFRLPELCHRLGIPVVATFHAGYDARVSWWSGLHAAVHRLYAGSLADYDRVITFSQRQREALHRLGVPPPVVAVIPNGVDARRYRPAAAPATPSTIIYCGRLDPDKNLEALCRTVHAWEAPPLPSLVLVGTGSERRRLARRFAGPRVRFTGAVDDEGQRIDLLQGSAIFALPSRIEGMSLAMLEAMACGLAVVATDVGAHREALAEAGLLLDPAHLEAQLRLALEVLITYPGFRTQLGAHARARVEARYDLGTTLNRLLRLYEELLDAHHLAALANR